MKNYYCMFCLLLALSGHTYAEDGNDVGQQPRPLSSSANDYQAPAPNFNQDSAPKFDQDSAPKFDKTPVPNFDQTQPSVVNPQKVDKWYKTLPFIIASTSMLFAIFGVIFGFRFRSQSKIEQYQANLKTEQDITRLTNKFSEIKLSKIIDQQSDRSLIPKSRSANMSDEEDRIKLLETTVEELKKKLAQVLIILTKMQNDPASSKVTQTKTHDGDFNFPMKASLGEIPTLVETVEPKSDEDILNLITAPVYHLLELPRLEYVTDIQNEIQKEPLQSLVKSYLPLRTNLSIAGSRHYDVLALILKKPLSNGANTLVYLRAEIGQHSSISAIFEGVPDGAKIKETTSPALLKQYGEQTLDFSEQNIIQKGTVNLG